MNNKQYYNKHEKIKVLKSYLDSLYLEPSRINKTVYQQMKVTLDKTETPLTKLVICKNIDYLKLAASILLTHVLRYPQYELIDIDSLMNLWLGYDIGKDKETIKICDTLIILSFGTSFFKNTKGLFESVVQKRQFDKLSTIALSTTLDKNIVSVFNKKDIIEFKGS